MTDFVKLFSKQPTYEELAAAFDGTDADITYINDQEVTVYYSPFRIFERPESCLNVSMFTCHKPETRPVIESMLGDFRSKVKDKVSYETTANGRPIRVCYQAMRTPEGEYLGCLEAVTYRDTIDQ